MYGISWVIGQGTFRKSKTENFQNYWRSSQTWRWVSDEISTYRKIGKVCSVFWDTVSYVSWNLSTISNSIYIYFLLNLSALGFRKLISGVPHSIGVKRYFRILIFTFLSSGLSVSNSCFLTASIAVHSFVPFQIHPITFMLLAFLENLWLSLTFPCFFTWFALFILSSIFHSSFFRFSGLLHCSPLEGESFNIVSRMKQKSTLDETQEHMGRHSKKVCQKLCMSLWPTAMHVAFYG